MKILFSSIIVLLLSFSVEAQFIHNKLGDIIPFSLTEKYKNLIDTSKINTRLFKSYNNDSLFTKHNEKFGISENSSVRIVGFTIDSSLISLQTVASKFKIDEGMVWLYKIESNTAEGFGIQINHLVLSDGGYICLYSNKKDPPIIYQKGDIIKPQFADGTLGNQLFVEYFVPNDGLKDGLDIIISQINYRHTSPFKKKEDEIKKDNNNNKFKSGRFGVAVNNCQYNVVCPEVSSWAKESRSIVFIFLTSSQGGMFTESKGTGFFVNKSLNYSNTDKPFIITCGHIYSPWVGTINYDFTNDPSLSSKYYVNYRDEICSSDPKPRSGQLIPGNFNIITKGSSYNKHSIDDPTYEENEDYTLVQSSKNVSELTNYNIVYAGWTGNQDFTTTGYAAIGHPNGDVQKVLVDDGYGAQNPNMKYVAFYFDKGVNEPGFSGSPVFSSSKKVVGWICTGEGDCSTVGQNIDRTTCGRFDRLISSISQYIDPTFQNQAVDSEPAPPELPAHCRDCIKNIDETDIDCGGTCLPCGIRDAVIIKSQSDIVKNNISARYELSTLPDPGNRVEFNSGAFNLTAGNSIMFANDVVVKQGVSLKAIILPALMSEPDRGCGSTCAMGAPAFTPNGDGINDYWVFGQAFVSKYSLEVFDRNGYIVYSKSNTPVYENGVVNAWDGSGIYLNGTYLYVLTFTGCDGTNESQIRSSMYVGGLKSLNLNEIQDKLTVNSVITNNDKTFNINTYPNPTTGKVSIDASNSDLLFDYILTDMTGKILVKAIDIIGSGEIDLSAFPSGLYLLQVKTGENTQLCKLIKK